MTAKEYLMQIRQAKQECETLEKKIEELRTQAAGIKAIEYDRDRVQVSPHDAMSELIIELITLEEEYGKRITNYHKTILLIESQIAEMSNRKYASILRARYIDGESLMHIAREWKTASGYQKYSYEHIRHMHGWALKSFEKQFLK